MKIKQIVFLSIMSFLLCLSNDLLSASPAIPKPGTPEFEQMMAQQMEELDKFLSTQSPEEQAEFLKLLSDLGQEIIDESVRQGYEDPFEFLSTQLEELEEEEIEPDVVATPETQETPQEKPVLLHESRRLEYLQQVLRSLAYTISSFRQKIINSPELMSMVAPFKYRLDDLIYFLNLFEDEQFTTYLLKKEFAELTQKIESLYETIAPLEAKLETSEYFLEGNDPFEVLSLPAYATQQQIVDAYRAKSAEFNPERIADALAKQGKPSEEVKKATQQAESKTQKIARAYSQLRQKEENKYLVNTIVTTIQQATEADGIIEGFKKVLESYKPEALQKSKDREKVEMEARKQQEQALKQRPAVQMAFDMPPAASASSWKPSRNTTGLPSFSPLGGGTPSAGSIPVLSPTPLPALPTTKAPSGSGGKPSSEKKDDKKGDDKSKEDKKEPSKSDKASDKKETSLDRDVIKKVVPVESALDAIKELIKKNKKMIQEMPFQLKEDINTSNMDAAKAKIQPQIQLVTDLVAQFTLISSTIKSAQRSFKDKKDQENAFKVELEKLYSSFEKGDETQILFKTLNVVPVNPAESYRILPPGKTDLKDVQTVRVSSGNSFIFYGVSSNPSINQSLQELNPHQENRIAALNGAITTAQHLMLGKKLPTGPEHVAEKKSTAPVQMPRKERGAVPARIIPQGAKNFPEQEFEPAEELEEDDESEKPTEEEIEDALQNI